VVRFIASITGKQLALIPRLTTCLTQLASWTLPTRTSRHYVEGKQIQFSHPSSSINADNTYFETFLFLTWITVDSHAGTVIMPATGAAHHQGRNVSTGVTNRTVRNDFHWKCRIHNCIQPHNISYPSSNLYNCTYLMIVVILDERSKPQLL
jgi:hypothetical protein